MSENQRRVELVAAWVLNAEEHFRVMNILLNVENPPWGSIAFNAQQTAEKYLKALLLLRGIDFPKTHDLSKLLTLFPEAPPLAWTPQDAAALSEQAVAPRYPDEFEPTGEREAQKVVGLAVDARQRIRDLLPTEALG